MKAAIIFNEESGNSENSPAGFQDLLESEISSDLFIINSMNIKEILEKIRWKNYDVIIAAGGDGTIRTVAEKTVKLNMKLGIIPIGTLNHFAKDINIPPDQKEAVEIIKKGKSDRVDTAEVNGYLFLNNSSIGLYPKMVKKRKKEMKPGVNKWKALVKAIIDVFKSMSFIEVSIESNGKEIGCITPFVFIGNNDYRTDLFNLGKRTSLKEGKLSIYYPNYRGRISYVKFIFKTLLGKSDEEGSFNVLHEWNVTLNTKKGELDVSLDGEVIKIKTPLYYKINPKSINIIVP